MLHSTSASHRNNIDGMISDLLIENVVLHNISCPLQLVPQHSIGAVSM
jgi:hypothetical protein